MLMVPAMANQTRALAFAIVGAIVHLALVFLALVVLAGGSSNIVQVPPYIVAGLLLVGAIPAVLFTTDRVVSPSILVLGLFSLSFFSTWIAYQQGDAPFSPMGPPPFHFYMFQWPLLIGVIFLFAYVEQKVRRATD